MHAYSNFIPHPPTPFIPNPRLIQQRARGREAGFLILTCHQSSVAFDKELPSQVLLLSPPPEVSSQKASC